jgi:integrase
MLRRYRDDAETRGIAKTFNAARGLVIAYLSDRFDKETQLLSDVRSVKRIRQLVKREVEPLTVHHVEVLCDHLRPDIAAMARTVAYSGMRCKEEYYDSKGLRKGPWKVLSDRIRLNKTVTQTKGGPRDIPLVYSPAEPTVTDRYFNKHLSKAGKKLEEFPDKVTMLTLRHTFIRIMESVGIPRWRRKKYVGHSKKGDAHEGYQSGSIEQYIALDAARMREWIESQKKGKVVVTGTEDMPVVMTVGKDGTLQVG